LIQIDLRPTLSFTQQALCLFLIQQAALARTAQASSGRVEAGLRIYRTRETLAARQARVTVRQTIAQAHFALAQQAILQTTLRMLLTMMTLIVSANIRLAETRLAGCLTHQCGSPQVLSAENTLQQYLPRLGQVSP